MLGGRQDSGMQQAKPDQERSQTSLCSGAKDELDPRSSRLWEQRERGLLRSRVSHDSKLETQLLIWRFLCFVTKRLALEKTESP